MTLTQTTQSTKQIVLPDGIHIPEYLEQYLTSITVPDKITMNFLIKLGADALNAKIADVELFNMTVKTGKKRIPNKLEFDDVAVILMSLYIFKNIQMTSRADDTILAMYIDDPDSPKHGIYDTNRKTMFEIMERIVPNFKNRDMQDVLDKIERSVETVEQTKDKHLFIVKNGIFNKRTGACMPFSPDYVYLTRIPVEYKSNPVSPVIFAPDGYRWTVDDWIDDLTDHDHEIATLIWQVIADCLQPHYSRHKSVWFYSERGNNGKGTIGQLIKNLLGEGNYASLSVADFNHEFLKETLLGVAANISDENDVNIFIDSIKDYKASVTGDDININRKYEKPLRIQFHGTNIQMMNGLPKTQDKSDSFYRRLILVPFLKSFTNNGERKYIKSDYIHRQDVLEYVLHKALNMDFDEFIIPKASAELLESYKEKNNPVLEFWNELEEEFVWNLLPTQFLYDLFVKWSEVNNPSGKVMSKRTFTDTLSSIIQNGDFPWEIKTGQNDKVRTQDRMKADEPLISEYGLDRPDKGGKPTAWMHPTYAGSDPEKRREFKRKVAYRGYLRL